MKTNRLALTVVLTSVMYALPSAQEATDGTAVPFSDPGRPGFVRVSMLNGSIVVKGENRKDVLVTTRANGEAARVRQPPAPSAGLRRLTQGAGITITEENNQVTVTGSPFRSGDVELRVPNRVNLKLSSVNAGNIVVENVDGDIEAKDLNGSIRLTNVAGSVVADSNNGAVQVTLTRLTSDKPMAFTSFNGKVDVTLPPSAKANLKLRSDQGDVYSDFDLQMRPLPAPQTARRSDGRTRILVNQSIYGSINGGGPEFELRSFNGDVYVRKGTP